MKFKDSFDRGQLIALCTVIVLVPALRLFPSVATQFAGRAAWLSAPAALFPVLLYILFLDDLMERRMEGEGLAELLMRALGPVAGKIALGFSALWFLFYGGFMLRAGADRFITTIYPNSSSPFFSVTMGILGTVAAMGAVRSLVRVAKMVQPVVLGVLLLVLVTALFSVDMSNLLPVTRHDILPIAEGGLAAVNVLTVVLYLVCFIEGLTPKKTGRVRSYSLWALGISVLMCVISFDIIGNFSPELTASLTQPFFSLVRNIVFFRTLERVEALVGTLWVFPDFLMISLLLYCAQHCIRLIMGHSGEYQGEKLLDLRRGRWVIPLCGLISTVASVLMAPNAQSLEFWSEKLIPLINLGYALLFVPAVYLVGRARKTL